MFIDRHILAIHAHPDDIEILAAGTLSASDRRGHEVTIATMTPGDCGTAEYRPEEIARIRRKEARNAAEHRSERNTFAPNFGTWRSSMTTRRAGGSPSFFAQVQPDIVLTCVAGRLSLRSRGDQLTGSRCLLRRACAELQESGTLRLVAIPHLYFCDPDEGRDREGNVVTPDFVVDVAKYID